MNVTKLTLSCIVCFSSIVPIFIQERRFLKCMIHQYSIADNLSIFNQEKESYYILVFVSQFCSAISLPVNNPTKDSNPTNHILFSKLP